MNTAPAEANVGNISVKYMISIPTLQDKCNYAGSVLDGIFYCSAVCGIPKKHKIPIKDQYWVGWVQTIIKDDIILTYQNGTVAVVRTMIDKAKDQDNRQGRIDPRLSWFESTTFALQPLTRMLGEEEDVANTVQQEKDEKMEGRKFVDMSKQLLADYEKLKPRSAIQKLTHTKYEKKLKETEQKWTTTLENRNKQRIVHFWDGPCLTIPYPRPVYDAQNKKTTDSKNIGFMDPIKNESPLVSISGKTKFALWLAVTYNSEMVDSKDAEGYAKRPIGPQNMGQFNPLYNIIWVVDWSATVDGKNVTPTGGMTVKSHGAGKGKYDPTLSGDPATSHVGVRIYAAGAYKPTKDSE